LRIIVTKKEKKRICAANFTLATLQT